MACRQIGDETIPVPMLTKVNDTMWQASLGRNDLITPSAAYADMCIAELGHLWFI